MIKEIIQSQQEYHKPSGKFNISSVNSCWRKKYLTLKGLYKEEYDAKAIRNFNIGDMFHKQIVKELLEKSPQFGLNVVSAEVDIPEHPLISGRADVIISSTKGEMFVVDVKSCGTWTFNNTTNGNVSENYINQLQLYLHFFNIKKGYLLFYCKNKGEVEEKEIEYDEVKANSLIKEIEDFFNNYVNKDIEPQLCDGGKWGCECCYPNGN